jgi:hypothetical protein
MAQRRSKQLVLDEEFLVLRAKVLEIAAGLDRLERSPGDEPDDPRLGRVRRALEILLDHEPDRAERVQLLFSRQYERAWRESLGL